MPFALLCFRVDLISKRFAIPGVIPTIQFPAQRLALSGYRPQHRPQYGPESYGPFAIWTSAIDYFEQARGKIDSAIYKLSRSTGLFPQDDETFDKAMADSGVNFRQLVDPWGHPYYVKYSIESEYGDATRITYQPDARVQTGTAVTRKLAWIRIMSPGPDGKANTPDDFPVASFSRDIAEQSGKDLIPQSIASEPLSGNTGAINGVVTDSSGAVVSNASVVATLRQTGQKFTATTGADGAYIIRNIPPGTYDMSISAPGFRATQIRTVPVHSTSITAVNVVAAGWLGVGNGRGYRQMLVNLETTSSSVAVSKSAEGTKVQVHEETFTPRLRDYFPETLFWSPSVITDANGRALLKFKLADNITTWKMTVLASNKTGEIGVADREIQAFQPFFLEHDPPKILTIGDVIDLPVVVRNYLPQAQQLSVEMKPASWFELEHPGKQEISVGAGESTTATFPFRATAMVKAGKQQVYGANRYHWRCCRKDSHRSPRRPGPKLNRGRHSPRRLYALAEPAGRFHSGQRAGAAEDLSEPVGARHREHRGRT